jgi:hypothetical protein
MFMSAVKTRGWRINNMKWKQCICWCIICVLYKRYKAATVKFIYNIETKDKFIPVINMYFFLPKIVWWNERGLDAGDMKGAGKRNEKGV